MDQVKKINVNVGVLGHVDSGKTSLCKTLSTTQSTAAFDNNPQSKERGITLDLGFSSFTMPSSSKDFIWNFTLVDCPGHSSLIRTVIGGSQIMDIMLLIIDINKGMQLQAAECLILAQITSNHLIVVLNKVDCISPDSRNSKIEKVTKLMRGALSKTKFKDEPIISASALDNSIGVDNIKNTVLEKVEKIQLERNIVDPFLMAVDHCFSIKGQGTVLTGTILQGNIKINNAVELPSLKETRKVKSIQSFRVSVQEANAGDRVGLCLPGLDSTLVERTLISAPNFIQSNVRACVINFERISFYKQTIKSLRRFHISVSYTTTAALITLFKIDSSVSKQYNPDLEYEYLEEFSGEDSSSSSSSIDKKINFNYFALLEFDKAPLATPNSILIGSDLQNEGDTTCRIAFTGRILSSTQEKNYQSTYLPNIKIYRPKLKVGALDRIMNSSSLIAKGFCKKESKIDYLLGLNVIIKVPNSSENEDKNNSLIIKGNIESRFGQTNKVRVALNEPLETSVEKRLKDNLKSVIIELKFKKYLFSVDKSKIIQ